VERGGDGYDSPTPGWSALRTWPTSNSSSISLFIRHVNIYFAFYSPARRSSAPYPPELESSLSAICLHLPRKLFSLSRRNTLKLPLEAILLLGLAVAILPAAAKAQTPPAAKKPVAASSPSATPLPSAPLSTHFPILLLAFGESPSWDVRIGSKGPELLQRQGYPPVLLEPGEITREGTADIWIYHAKDVSTSADLSLLLSREPCSDSSAATTKYTFKAVVQHSQIGKLQGCARIAAELFPRLPGQTAQGDDDDTDKKKPPALPPITNAKAPAAVAFLTPAGKIVVSRNGVKKIAAPIGTQLALSHDGKRLLYIRQDSKSPALNTIVLYEFESARSRDLVHGPVGQAAWSPDDSRIAYVSSADQKSQVWVLRPETPDKAAAFSSQPVATLAGWVDPHSVLACDSQNAYWLSEDRPIQTVALREIYGDMFQPKPFDTLSLNPANPDLLLVSAVESSTPPGAPTDAAGTAHGLFLYELRSKRRTQLTPPDQLAEHGVWSRDGLQVFYTRRTSAAAPSIFRILWDGTGIRRYADGSDLTVGE
jgi:uncharacterized membrane protein